MDTLQLKQFILDASRNTYASEDVNLRQKQADNSTTIVYEKDNWKYHDNYFGGEPYGGREVVFYDNKPVWMMVYYGWVEEGNKPEEIYKILSLALRNSTLEMPYRGPSEISDGSFKYINKIDGEAENFSGEEKIFNGDTLVYCAKYIGGLVDKS